MSTGIIYGYVHPKTGNICYIGQTLHPKQREASHRYLANANTRKAGDGGKLLHRAMRKNGGYDAFSYVVLANDVPESLLNELETSFIQEHDTYVKNGEHRYNLVPLGGVTRGFEFSEEQREAMSHRRKGHPAYPRQVESVLKRNTGRVVSEESRRRSRDSQAGSKRPHTPEQKSKIAAASKKRAEEAWKKQFPDLPHVSGVRFIGKYKRFNARRWNPATRTLKQVGYFDSYQDAVDALAA